MATDDTATDAASQAEQKVSTARLLEILAVYRLPLILGGAVFIALVVALVMWVKQPTYRVLFTNLTASDGGAIIDQLSSQGIPYKFREGTGALLVPSGQVHELRLQLAQEGLPKGGNVGFELMENQPFGMSQFAEHVNFQRALEGELSRTIESLSPVHTARVHLAISKPTAFIRERKPSSGTVVLHLQPGRVLSSGQVQGIVHMISSSVTGLSTDHVTIIDQRGKMLSHVADSTENLTETQLQYVQVIETSVAKRIEDILSPIMGAENVRAQVSATVDFSQREQTSERFRPNQNAQDAAVRSHQISEQGEGEGAREAAGIPGALSNQPPEGELGVTEGEGGQAVASAKNSSREVVTNFELDKTINHIKERSGQLERLSVAVVVNYKDDVDEEGNPTTRALTDQEMDNIKRLVLQAMGHDQARGDQLEVVNSPFSPLPPPPEPEPWYFSGWFLDLVTQAVKGIVALFAGLWLYRRLVKPFLNRKPKEEAIADTKEEMERQINETQLLASVGAKEAAYSKDIETLQQMAKDDPRLIAMIVRNWMGTHG